MDYFSETKQEHKLRASTERNNVPHSLELTGDDPQSEAIMEQQAESQSGVGGLGGHSARHKSPAGLGASLPHCPQPWSAGVRLSSTQHQCWAPSPTGGSWCVKNPHLFGPVSV